MARNPDICVIHDEFGELADVAWAEIRARVGGVRNAVIHMDGPQSLYGVHKVRITAEWEGKTYPIYAGDALIEGVDGLR